MTMTRKEAIHHLHTYSTTMGSGQTSDEEHKEAKRMAIEALSAEAEMDGDMGEVSDGYHTFNQLYHQRAVLFATIVKQNKEKAWKSWKHGDGKFCFDSDKEWFIVGVDTPKGSYTYHYEKKYWDMFDCVELEHGKFWDGHTEEDVTRLLSLPSAEAVQGWITFTRRPMTEEEQEDYPNCTFIFDCDLPDDGDEILVSNGLFVWTDTFCNDIDGCYLDGGNDIDEDMAWMPLPKPYKGGEDE